MTRADTGLILLAGALIGWLYLNLWGGSAPAAGFRVNHGNDATELHPLDRDRKISVEGPLGRSVLEVRNGALRFASSPCRQKICMRAGWQRRSGAAVACVPNRISVVLGGSEDSEFDAMNF